MNERLTAIVGARISEFKRKMADVRKDVATLPREVTIEIKENFNRTNRRLDALADKLRMFQTLSRSMAMGSLLAVSPASIPLMAGLVASLAMLGPMMGVLAGSTFALATAFGVAGAGAVAFGSMAIPTITKLFEEGAKLNAQQQEARAGWDRLAETWQRINKAIEPKILEAFTKTMDILHSVLHEIEPMFEGVANAVNRLLDSLKQSINSKPMQDFFLFLNANAGPMLETIGKSFGNFMQGLMSMMVAFGPLAQSTSQGFLDMSKRFSNWASQLSDSKGFQSFVKYVEQNMPKIRGIFRDGIAGIIYFFSAFGPLASDMMTGLADMMKRFKDWSRGLGQNQAFQNFIQYIRDNGPMMKQFIRELTDFIAELVSQMAPFGAKVLEVTTNLLSMANEFIRNNQWVGDLLAKIITGIGLFKLFAPLIFTIATHLGGLWNVIKIVSKHVSKLWGWINKKLLPVFTRLFLAFGRIIPIVARVGSIFLRFIGGPISWLIQAIILIAIVVVKNWDKIKAWTIKAFNKIKAHFKGIWDFMKEHVFKRLGDMYDEIKDIWGKIFDFFADINLYDVGQDIMQGLINGISSMASSAVGAVKDIGSSIKSGFTNFFNIHSPSRLMDKEVGQMITLGIGEGMTAQIRKVQSMARQVSQSIMPELSPMPIVEGANVNVGTPNNYESREETHVNMAGVFQGAELTIREDADIEKIAQALGERLKQRKRARGVR